eukprot:313485_1
MLTLFGFILLAIITPQGECDNWRFIYSPTLPCNCHGSLPTTWASVGGCVDANGEVQGNDQRKYKYQSVNFDCHAPGSGISYFWSNVSCHGTEVQVISLADNTGKNVYVTRELSGDTYLYTHACYCYGGHSPCSC